MTFTILFFATRKPGVSPEEFKENFENVQMPLLREVSGEHFPLSHTRRYIRRTEGEGKGTTRNASTPAQVLVGSQADFDYDVVSQLVFQDAAAFQAFMAFAHTPEKAARVVANEELFMDRAQTRAVVLGATEVTKRE
ncbi:EthD domain-containing protein [Daldinia sp. FL1419]|nr:EthD domain-containing protein [Daldinia sp. FL1419]